MNPSNTTFKRKDGSDKFIVYAHRGASEYCPENTMLSFYTGIFMGANGIETDVQITKDGVLVLFHDDTLARVTGAEGSICDYTYEELLALSVKKNALTDKIPTFEDFLSHFAHRDITFAIELKVGGIEKAVADMIFKYGIEEKTVVTSFELDYVRNIKKYAPSLKVGYLCSEMSDSLIAELLSIGADEICPKGILLTPENVTKCHELGLGVRAWGISNVDIMKTVYDVNADGMTVNFPDRLIEYIS